jgi:hypothetical protein
MLVNAPFPWGTTRRNGSRAGVVSRSTRPTMRQRVSGRADVNRPTETPGVPNQSKFTIHQHAPRCLGALSAMPLVRWTKARAAQGPGPAAPQHNVPGVADPTGPIGPTHRKEEGGTHLLANPSKTRNAGFDDHRVSISGIFETTDRARPTRPSSEQKRHTEPIRPACVHARMAPSPAMPRLASCSRGWPSSRDRLGATDGG